MIAFIVVFAVFLFLWNNGFNVYVGGLLSAYIGTWIEAPIAGIIFTGAVIGLYTLLKFLKLM